MLSTFNPDWKQISEHRDDVDHLWWSPLGARHNLRQGSELPVFALVPESRLESGVSIVGMNP